jgi:hypothetical protein
VHETLDGETIVIHLETGSYYSLTGSGSEIWTLLEAGGSVEQLCAELARRHQLPEHDIRDQVENFIADLEHEELVETGDRPEQAMPSPPTGANGTWASPRLERYDDMRDFLLVDPIHEVDASGWPSREDPE